MINSGLIEGFEQVRFSGKRGQPYRNLQHPKILTHTWEGTSWSSAMDAFDSYPPHCAASIYDKRKVQFVPLDRASYALAGDRNDLQFTIQIELAGFANATDKWSDEDYKWLADEVYRPILNLLPSVPLIAPPSGFHGEGEGIILASPSSPIRFNDEDYLYFSGFLGHQHAPAPNHHWDPGRFKIDTLFKFLRLNDPVSNRPTPPTSPTPPTPQDFQMIPIAYRTDAPASAPNYRQVYLVSANPAPAKWLVKTPTQLQELIGLGIARVTGEDGEVETRPDAWLARIPTVS